MSPHNSHDRSTYDGPSTWQTGAQNLHEPTPPVFRGGDSAVLERDLLTEFYPVTTVTRRRPNAKRPENKYSSYHNNLQRIQRKYTLSHRLTRTEMHYRQTTTTTNHTYQNRSMQRKQTMQNMQSVVQRGRYHKNCLQRKNNKMHNPERRNMLYIKHSIRLNMRRVSNDIRRRNKTRTKEKNVST